MNLTAQLPNPPRSPLPSPESGSKPLQQTKRRRRWPFLVFIAFVLAGVGTALAFAFPLGGTSRGDLQWAAAKIGPLPVTVVEKGQLESTDNRDIICKVKAGAKGTFASTIRWVIEDGSIVTKNQLLIELDDSALQDQYKAQQIVVDKSKAEWVKAEEELTITVKQNEADIVQALGNLRVAELDLDKFLGFREESLLAPIGALVGGIGILAEKGEYRSQLDDVSGRLKQAESDLDAYRERAAWAERSVKLGYLTPSQARVELTKMSGGSDTVEKLRKEKYILEHFTRDRTLTDLKAKLEVARIGHEKALIQALSKEVQADNDRKTKRSVLQSEQERLDEIREQLQACKIYAPQPGMVVYVKPDSGRYSQTSQGLIAQGEQVKEGQKLMRLPDLRHMQVNTKVHEALVASIKGDERQSTGVYERMRFGQSFLPDRLSWVMSHSDHTQSAIREQIRDKEYITTKVGQRATVRVDAFPRDVFNGHVRTVAQVASSLDWGSDVKTYQTLVVIDDVIDDPRKALRPDMNAEVTIHVDDNMEPVLQFPIHAVIGGAEAGATRTVYVKTADGPKERQLTLGKFNDKMIQVIDGLTEGEEVLTNPKAYIGDKAKTREEGADSPKGRRPGGSGGDKKGDSPKGDSKKGGGGPPKK